MVMKPSYEPGAGRDPVSCTEICRGGSPGLRVTLAGVILMRAFESLSRGATDRLKVVLALPVFARLRVRLTGRAVIAPKESVAGSTVAPAARAVDAFNLPAPTAVTRAVPELSVTFCVAVLT